MPDFLLEIGTEEIPAGFIPPAMEWLKKNFIERLRRERVIVKSEDIEMFATPRRLTMYCRDLWEESASETDETFGPPVSAAYDEDGNPTKALIGFLAKFYMKPGDQKTKKRKITDKEEYCYVRIETASENTRDILKRLLPSLISAIPFPKSMYWKDSKFLFARPIRNICAVFANVLVEFEAGGIRSCPEVFAHPFLSPGTLPILEADLEKYKNLLRNHFVYVDQDERRKIIKEKIDQISASIQEHD